MAENFPLEKILNVSATEYCASVGKELKDYELRGVIVYTGEDIDLPRKFSESVPSNAEVVVGYRMATEAAASLFSSYTAKYASGTAMIPKKE